jgi:2-dehydropantoate 2-reductase
MKEQVNIIGSGAIGKALAVFLSKAGKEVRLFRGRDDNGAACREMIRVELGSGKLLEEEINVGSLAELQEFDGPVVLATKSFGNARLASILQNKIDRFPLVILQNGLGVEQPFLTAGFRHIYRCVLFVTSQVMEDGLVRFKPVSVCPVGTINGTGPELKTVVSMLNTPEFSFGIEEDIQPVIWRKAIVNSVFNSVCPLLDVDNGIFHREERALEIAKGIIAECLEVAKACGVVLTITEVSNSLLQISRASDGQLISTLQDIRRGRPTEIGTLNLEIARLADFHNLVSPQTKLLGELTAIRSSLSLTP